jgi:uncharacterized protein (DUF433 family)
MTKERPTYQERIVQDPKILVGKPVIKGTRIPVSLVLNLLAHGADHEEIKADYPNLTDEDILAAIAYAADHIDREATESVRRPL